MGFITSLFNIRSRSSALVYIGFATLFGYAISFYDSSADSFRYAQAFNSFDNTLDYQAVVGMYRAGELRDLYRILLFYFTSLFTNNPKVMYAFAGLIYGIFSYWSLRIFVMAEGNRWDKYVFILALVFFTFISLSNINGFRFWTGGLVLFYSTYSSIIQKKTVWILGVILTPLFHYGFLLIVPIIVLFKFIQPILYNGSRVRPIMVYVFILSFIASWLLGTNSINISFLTDTDVLTGQVGSRLRYVNSSEVSKIVEDRKEASLFLGVQKYFNYGVRIYIFISILFVYNLLKKLQGNKTDYNRFFAFILFFYSVSLIAISFPSGARFLNIGHLFLFLFLVKLYTKHSSRTFRTMIFWALPIFSFNILFTNFLLPVLILTPTIWYGNLFWIIIEGLNFTTF